MMDDDDDSSSDSDYCPENDGNESESDHGADEVKGIMEITAGRKRKAYSTFDDLKQQDENETKAKMTKALNYKDFHQPSTGKSPGGSQKKKRKVIDQYNEMLASVFGAVAPKKKKVVSAKTSSKIVKKTGVPAAVGEQQSAASPEIDATPDTSASPVAADKIRLAALEVAKQVLKKTKVVETKKFAGRDITYVKACLVHICNYFKSTCYCINAASPSLH